MESRRWRFGRGFRVLFDRRGVPAAQMVLEPGACEGGPDNLHRGADQWLYVAGGHGEAVVVRKNVGETSAKASKQGEITESVFTASNEATQAIQEVSGATDMISHSTDSNLETARGSLDSVMAPSFRVRRARREPDAASKTTSSCVTMRSPARVRISASPATQRPIS